MRPTLLLNPVSDRTFQAFAERLLDEGGGETTHEFQARLRVRYPQAVVRARDIAAERRVVWYVYRDGHWTDR